MSTAWERACIRDVHNYATFLINEMHSTWQSGRAKKHLRINIFLVRPPEGGVSLLSSQRQREQRYLYVGVQKSA